MMKRMNKKGLGFIWIVALILSFMVISIFASFFGLKLLQKTIDELGWQTIGIFLIVVLAIVFRPFVQELLMTILTVIKSIFGFIKSAV